MTGIEQSDEALQHLLQSWFATYLGRQPTSSEQSSLVNLLQSGMTEEQLLSDLLGSAEYFSGTPQIAPESGRRRRARILGGKGFQQPDWGRARPA